MAKGIWIVIEQSKAEIRKVSLELLSQGRVLADRTGEPLAAVILGKGIEGLAGKAVPLTARIRSYSLMTINWRIIRQGPIRPC